MARISVPTTAPLPSSLRVDPSNVIASKILGRLSRSSLLSLALEWLDGDNGPLSSPYLAVDEDDDMDEMQPAASTMEELCELYTNLRARKGSKREVLDRILEGDWRQGLSLYQLAMADLQYLYDHPTSQKWTAFRIVPLKPPETQDENDASPMVDKQSLIVPRFHPSSFLKRLQAQILPDIKAHYNFDRHRELSLLLLRIFVVESPYNTALAAVPTRGEVGRAADFETSRTICIAFPDASPHIYISKPQSVGTQASGESKSLRRLIIEGIPKALSCSRQRYTLKTTSLTTRNLSELLDRRGAGRTNAAGGGWSIYADTKEKESPLSTVLPSSSLSEEDALTPPALRTTSQSIKRTSLPSAESDVREAKRLKMLAKTRFGTTAVAMDGKGVERVDLVLEDAFMGLTRSQQVQELQGDTRTPSLAKPRENLRSVSLAHAYEHDDEDDSSHDHLAADAWRPNVRLTFHGTHVFAGIRQLVEYGIVNGEAMPGWMTGEEGVTVGAVRHGRIRGHKGAGV